MANFRTNVVANYLGQVWSGLIALAFLPLYIQYLGVEAYGLIAVFSTLVALFSVLDAGLSPTLSREMALFRDGLHSSYYIRTMLSSMELCVVLIGFIAVFGIFLFSDYLASRWLKIVTLDLRLVSDSIKIMGVIIALRIYEGLYRGALYGLNQQVNYNVLNIVITTVRYLGALLIMLWFSRSIEVFFCWQLFISIFFVLILRIALHLNLPKHVKYEWFSLKLISGVGKFTGGMFLITLLSILMLQMDKLVIASLLSIQQFAYYALAAVAASVLYTIIVPITQAIYPQLVVLSMRSEESELIRTYHNLSQLAIAVISPPALILCLFSFELVYVWSGNVQLAKNVSPLLSVLGLGAFLNCLAYIPFQIQIAFGWTRLLVKINAFLLITMILLVYWLVPIYGPIGAAWIWVGINAVYLISSLHFMHLKIMKREKFRWYFDDLLKPFLAASMVSLIGAIFKSTNYENRIYWALYLVTIGFLSVCISLISASRLRSKIISLFRA